MNVFASPLAVRLLAVGTVAVGLVSGFGDKVTLPSAAAQQSRGQEGGGAQPGGDRESYRQGYRQGFSDGLEDSRRGGPRKRDPDGGGNSAYERGYRQGYQDGYRRGSADRGPFLE
jgi:hypothetical protein